MKYETKYGECEVGDEFYEDHCLRVLAYSGFCRTCGRPTRFMYTSHDELSCSDECSYAYDLLMTKRVNIFEMPRKIKRITPERCYVVFKERDVEDNRIRKYGWAVGTIDLNHFYILFDDGTPGFPPLKRTAFISKKPHIDINRFRGK